jgi:hypothetical protein
LDVLFETGPGAGMMIGDEPRACSVPLLKWSWCFCHFLSCSYSLVLFISFPSLSFCLFLGILLL